MNPQEEKPKKNIDGVMKSSGLKRGNRVQRANGQRLGQKIPTEPVAATAALQQTESATDTDTEDAFDILGDVAGVHENAPSTGTPMSSADGLRKPEIAPSRTSSLDLLPTQTRSEKIRAVVSRVGKAVRRLTWKHWALIIAGVAAAAVIGVGAYAYYIASHTITDKENQTGFFGQVQRIVNPNSEPLHGEENDRINVLLMGKGGDGHPGGELVDTIMVASIQPSTKKVALISLPRDLVIPHYPNGQKYPDYRKINNVVFLGGTDFAKETMKTVLGLDIHYVVEVDFTGFRSVVDTIDGVDVNVPNAFTGYYGAKELKNPCPKANLANLDDGAYCAITFAVGDEHMDGERALQYARIRKMAPGSENPEEGTDFKRAARQQLVLQAIKDKVLSVGTLANPVRISNLLKDLGDHVSTNMEVWEMTRFVELVQDVDRNSIKNIVIDQGENGLVHRDPSVAAYVLVPNAGVGDYSEIQHVALNVFDETAVAGEQTKQTIAAEQAVVIVQNGTATEGLASRVSSTVRTAGIPVTSFSNAAVKTVTATTLFDLSGNTKPETRKALEQQFGITAVDATLTQVNASVRIGGGTDTSIIDKAEIPANASFVLIVGADQATARTQTGTNANTNTNAPVTNTNGNTNAQNSTNTNGAGSVRIIPSGSGAAQ